MSNAIAQSATDLAVSPNGEAMFDYVACVQRCGERQAKGLTRERLFLNRSKLISATCADYRMHFASIYGKTERLPAAVFERLETEVDKFIASAMAAVNPVNIQSMRRSFAHKANDLCFVERVTLTGENQLTLKEQLFGCNLAIGAVEKRLAELQVKKTPDYDREKVLKGQLMKLNLTREFIAGELKHQETVAPSTPAA